jgi:pimeloyl-ACP methyl ester carboxylesterase
VTTFALVHGGWHGAWCWERLTPFLQQAGHDVVTMDLPSEDGTATFDTYADVVCAALTGCDDVVLVGHSLGGNAVPLVAARRPVRHLVYLCAMVPDPGRSVFDQLGDELQMLNPAYEEGLSVPDEQLCQDWVDVDIARTCFTAIVTSRPSRLPSTASGRSRHFRRSSRFRCPNFRLCRRPTWCAATIRFCVRNGRDAPPSGSAPSSSSFPATIRRSIHGRRFWQASCSI